MSEKEFPTFEKWLIQRLEKLEAAVSFYIIHVRQERSGEFDDSTKYAKRWEKEIENIMGPIR
jgi:hypothetical protein